MNKLRRDQMFQVKEGLKVLSSIWMNETDALQCTYGSVAMLVSNKTLVWCSLCQVWTIL